MCRRLRGEFIFIEYDKNLRNVFILKNKDSGNQNNDNIADRLYTIPIPTKMAVSVPPKEKHSIKNCYAILSETPVRGYNRHASKYGCRYDKTVAGVFMNWW